MRYLYACFEGYIGFYTGLGLNKVEIDFTKCKHNIVLITGMNGCGKSTLMNSLSFFPDDSSSFVNFLDASKTLRLLSGEDIYDIYITSPSDGKGGRKQTKAFIKKNGIELNENGNITSYKDIIFSEFELDSNYISLSKLSSVDRGLGDKKPAERKRFASSIIDNMEVYNNIYKTLNKKSLVLKATINNLHTKIQNIGSRENLELTLSKLEETRKSIAIRINSLNTEIISIQAKNSIDESEAKEIEELTRSIEELSSIVEGLKSNLSFYETKTKISTTKIEDTYNSDKSLLENYKAKVETLTTIWRGNNERIKGLERNASELEASINTYSSDSKNQDIDKVYSESNNRLKAYERELNDLGIPADINLIDSLTRLLSFYQDFISILDRFYDELSSKDIKLIVNWYDGIIEENNQSIEDTESALDRIKEELAQLEADKKLIAILSERPKNCKIDNCYFISSALNIKKKYKGSIESQISAKLEQKDKFSYHITELSKYSSYLNSMLSKRLILRQLRDLISKYSTDIQIFDKDFIDTFESNLINMFSFNNQRDPRRFIDGLNTLKMYKEEEISNSVYESKYEAFKEQMALMNSNKKMLEEMKEELEALYINTSEVKRDLDKYSSLKESLSIKIEKEAEYYGHYTRYISKVQELDILQARMAEYNKKSSKLSESVGLIAKLKMDLDKATEEMTPIDDDITRIKGQLVLLDSYYLEYNEYMEKNNIIETVKKYCSPTGGGIQTIFIQLYMRKTLELSNEVLAMLFNGQYKLLDFIINEKEFRIPFVGPSGLPADDISSGSMSQVEMMGMVINLVLLYQASTRFNIAYLDEIASGLDNHNQAEFIKVIYYVSKYLNMEQVFLICHSLAVDESGVDIIRLKDYEEFENQTMGNIIYDYKNEQK